jgi:hypothetical protein
MNMRELKKTEWAKEFKTDNSVEYDHALDLASGENVCVKVVHTNEAGKWEWAIFPVENTEFWFMAYRTKRDALALCKEMGWKVVK